jgi:hypothetical protein
MKHTTHLKRLDSFGLNSSAALNLGLSLSLDLLGLLTALLLAYLRLNRITSQAGIHPLQPDEHHAGPVVARHGTWCSEAAGAAWLAL